MINRKAVIFGISSYILKKEEIIFLKKTKPWGIILFSRNIKDIKQLKKLIFEIKRIFNDNKFPILVDEEGGKVSRLNKIIDMTLFSQAHFRILYKQNKKKFINKYKIYINSVASILNEVGININTVPVLDVKRNYTNNVIGTRSFSSDQHIVSKLGNICIKLYKQNKICTIAKHIPGHGPAKSDSHFKTPIVDINKRDLIKKDFAPFKKCKSMMAMTAHIIYKKYDSINTATHSKIVINQAIRKNIKFKGILISDDISMKSLKFSAVKNAEKALIAGCNLILHCNGKLKEMKKISKVIPKIDKFTQKKTSDLYNFLR